MTAVQQIPINRWRTCLAVFFGSLLLLSVIGCAKIRLLTYPSEFSYLEADSVKGVMHEMTISLMALDTVIRQSADSATPSRYRPEVLAELQNLEALAISVSSSTTGKTLEGEARPVTNHLLIDEHIDEFIGQIMKARFQAEAEPPNYYGAGQLTGNCNACHRMR
ncbi:MAG: hypothetical protein HKN42_13435 [Granulosicoccus sp.]|nr:hypothetical protein [Granulosicoccus sp.]